MSSVANFGFDTVESGQFEFAYLVIKEGLVAEITTNVLAE